MVLNVDEKMYSRQRVDDTSSKNRIKWVFYKVLNNLYLLSVNWELVVCVIESTFKRSYLLDRRKMNGQTLSEADMEYLRRRMAENRVFDVTEVSLYYMNWLYLYIYKI